MAIVGGLGREKKAFLVGLCQEKTPTRHEPELGWQVVTKFMSEIL